MALSRQVIDPGSRAVDQSRKFNLPLSPAVQGGDFVFLSGMAAIDPATSERAHGTVAAETRQILTNIGELRRYLHDESVPEPAHLPHRPRMPDGSVGAVLRHEGIRRLRWPPWTA